MAAKPKQQGQLVKLSSCFSGLVDRQNKLVAQFIESQDYRDACQASLCSSSSVITVATWSKLSHSKSSSTLKNHVRAGVSPAVRRELWLAMSEVTDDDSVLFAKAFGEPADGMEWSTRD